MTVPADTTAQAQTIRGFLYHGHNNASAAHAALDALVAELDRLRAEADRLRDEKRARGGMAAKIEEQRVDLAEARAELERVTYDRGNAPVWAANRVNDWLAANKKAASDVNWARFPLGMVFRWIERAEKAEAELAAAAGREQQLRDALAPYLRRHDAQVSTVVCHCQDCFRARAVLEEGQP